VFGKLPWVFFGGRTLVFGAVEVHPKIAHTRPLIGEPIAEPSQGLRLRSAWLSAERNARPSLTEYST
jgi:hypothetical protein